MKNWPAAACEPHHAARLRHLRHDRVHLARDGFRDGRKADAVLVAERKIVQKVAHGGDSALCERSRAGGADASEILHGMGERELHRRRKMRATRVSLLLYHQSPRLAFRWCRLVGAGFKPARPSRFPILAQSSTRVAPPPGFVTHRWPYMSSHSPNG